MSDMMQKIQEETSISNRAMKFRLSRGGTQKRIRDKDAEALVKQALGDEGQIVSRELFKDKGNLVYQYQTLGNEMYAYHVKSTLPFGDDSSRVLPNMAYFDYTSKMGSFISRLDQLKQQINSQWPTLVATDVASRNSALFAQGKPQTAKIEDYPTWQQMDTRLYVNWYPEPISTSGDFRFQLPPEMSAQYDKMLEDVVDMASRDRFSRMLKPVSAFIDKLNRYTGEKNQKWYDSFIDNLNSLSTEIPALNIKDDPSIDLFLAEIKSIIQPYVFQPDVLKEDSAAREQVKARLQALEGQLKGYAL